MPNDRNDDRKNGRICVRCFSAYERDRLLGIAASVGIPPVCSGKREGRSTPDDTVTYQIDILRKTMRSLARPMIGAECSGGVRFYSVEEFARLAELKFSVAPRYPIFHVPHDGGEFPAELMEAVCVPPERFIAYHEAMRDTAVRRLIPRAHDHASATAIFEISRLLCDVERFLGPEEPMERFGMGFCYEKAYDGTKIKEVTAELKEKTLRCYKEHHRKVDALCRDKAQTLLIDLHSFSDRIVPKAYLKEGRETPDVCIGTDPRFTPRRLADLVRRGFEEAGFTTALNYPYSGCYVPESALTGESDCVSIMLEFNKRVYLNENGELNEEAAARIRDVIDRILADSAILGEHGRALIA